MSTKIINKNNDKIKYNTADLLIHSKNTLIIIDWDDTLYPTSWININNIDLTDPRSRYRYIKQFEQLDDQLYTIFHKMLRLGDVIIVTNALPEWINLATSILPKTRIYLSSIDIVSARLKYQNKKNMNEWKKYTFHEEIEKRSKNKKYINILSLGDADYEYNALISLYKSDMMPHKYLKSIKFIKSSDFDTLIEQIQLIKINIKKICKMQQHVDLVFDM